MVDRDEEASVPADRKAKPTKRKHGKAGSPRRKKRKPKRSAPKAQSQKAHDARSDVVLEDDLHTQAMVVAPLLAQLKHVYWMDEGLVRVRRDSKRAWIEELTPKTVGHLLQHRWRFLNGHGDPIVSFKPDVVEYILTHRPATFNEIVQVVNFPVFSPRGRLVAGRRYSPRDRLLVLSTVQVPELDPEPSAEDVAAARDALLGLVADFPFADDHASLAGALAFVVTLVARMLINGPVPIFVITAPMPGTGKSLLTNALGLLVLGEEPETMTLARSITEQRKEIASMLRERPAVIVFDNVNATVGGEVLASTVTTGRIRQRQLGSNDVMHLEHKSVFVFNGNNVTVSDEMARRTVLVALDANVERPAERTGFRIPDLMAYVQANRPELLRAVAVLVQNWIAKGKPAPAHVRPMGTFEEWREVVGGILEAAEVRGLLDNAEMLQAEGNREAQELSTFVEVWHEAFGTTPVSVRDLFPLVAQYHLLEETVGAGKPHSRKTRLGKHLESLKGRVISGLKIVSAGKNRTHKVWSYRLEAASIAGPMTASKSHEEPAPKTGRRHPVGRDTGKSSNAITKRRKKRKEDA